MKIFCLKQFLKITWLTCMFYTTYGKTSKSGRHDTRILSVDEKTQNTVACQGEKIKLKCSRKSTVLLFYSAYYGRAQKGRVVCRANKDLGMAKQDDIFCGQIDVTMKMKKICSQRTRCKFEVGDAIFGEICPKVYKYLNVIYTCVPRRRRKKGKTEPTTSTSTATPIRAAFTTPTNTSTNVTSVLLTNVTVTQSPTNSTVRATLSNVTSFVINVTNTPTQQRNASSSVLISHHAAVVEKTTAWTATSPSTTTVQVPMVRTGRSQRAMTGVLGSLILLVMHIRGNAKDYIPVLLSSVGATVGLSIVLALGCLCVRKLRRKEHPVTQEVEKQRVNGYRYKTSLSPITNGSPRRDSLARSTKGSSYGSTSSLDKKFPPPPPDMCSLDLEDFEQSRVGPPKYRDGLATIPKTNNTVPNNRNFDSYKPIPGSEVEYVIVQKRNGSKLYLNPMSSFEAETLARYDNKPRVVDPDPIATELKSLWNGGSGWPVNDGPRTENK